MACIDLTGRAVLVVGAAASRSRRSRASSPPAPRSPSSRRRSCRRSRSSTLTLVRRGYRTDDLDGKFLVVAATATTSVNRRVFRDAESRALLCNVVDVPELCSFILPAVHRHEPIAVAVSTGGASPALAQHLRDQIATVVRPEHAELAHRLRELRPWAKSHFATYEERKAYFAGLVAEELGPT